MAFPPISILGEKRSKIRTGAAKHFEGLAALSTHSAGRRAAVKAGCKPVHSSLDGCPLSCYFSGNVATTSGHFVHKSERRTRDGAFIYLPPLSENSPIFCSFPFAKIQPVFLPEQTGRKKAPHPVSPVSHASRYNTLHFASKVVCQWGQAPFGNPHKKRRYAAPPRDAYRLFLLSSPPAVTVEQKSAWDLCSIFNFVIPPFPILRRLLWKRLYVKPAPLA